LKTGLVGTFRPVGRDDVFKVKISGISPYIDPATGTATVELDLLPLGLEKSTVLPPGLMGKAEFKVRERNGIQVPEVAVIFKGKESFVRKLDGDTVKLAPVTLGSLKKGLYEILGGLEPGSTIVLHSSQYIGNGQKVDVQQDKAGALE
jgi:multidrug efflux pump subunit AcrA (membrane-fusion protein)